MQVFLHGNLESVQNVHTYTHVCYIYDYIEE